MHWRLCLLFFILVSFQLPDTGLKEGDPVPAFRFKTLSGFVLSPDSVKGNVLVIDFWASWCKPCRKNNIELVKLYEKYRQLNFLKKNKVLFMSFSLDSQEELWNIARAKDGLHWPYNISDLQGWESPVVGQFSLRRIPSNFIVNQEGKIAARNLWGRDLDSVLKVLNK